MTQDSAPHKQSLLFRSGDAFMSKSIRKWLETFIIGDYSSCIYITYWSVVHLISGILTYVCLQLYLPNIRYPYLVGLLIHTIWEMWQVFIGMSYPTMVSGHNGMIDTLMDTILFMVGMLIGNVVLETKKYINSL
jgi:hypothetical protein